MRKIKIIASFFFTILLWHIGSWEKNRIPFPFSRIDLPGHFYDDWLVDNRLEIGIICGVIVLLIQLIDLKNPLKIKQKKLLNVVLNNYIYDKLNGDNEKNRVTIFKVVRGYKVYPTYIHRCFVKNWKSHKKNGLIKYYMHKKFPNPFRQYLIQYTRNGYPFPNGSSTFFLVPTKDDEVSSLTAEAFYKVKPQKKELPSISIEEIRKIGDISKCKYRLRKDINSYMTQGKINSFEMLKTYHRLPTKIYADPIFLDDEKKWGCIVFDSNNENLNFENSYNDFVNYSRIVQSIISTLN